MNQPPSTLQICRNDYLAFFTLIVPPCLWALYIAVYLLPPALSGQPVRVSGPWIAILLALTAVMAILLAWRIWDLRQLFASADRVDGTVTQLRFLGNGGWMTYRYTYQGEAFEIRRRLIKTDRSLRLQQGGRIRVVVDPGEPKRSFVEALYY